MDARPRDAPVPPGVEERRGARTGRGRRILSRLDGPARVSAAGLSLLALAGCGPAAPSGRPEAPRSLAGTEWRLVELAGAAPVPGPDVTLEIDEVRLGGYAGCNWYGAEYVAEGGRIEIGQAEGTARGCAEPPLEEQEAAYLRALGEAASYRVSGGELVLADRRGRDLLRFRRHLPLAMDPADLAGTGWRLVAIDGAPPPGVVTIVLRFGESTIEGFAGCRGFTGTYGARGEKIHVTSLGMTETECTDADRHEVEHRFVSRLSESARYRLGGGRLELSTDSGGALAFVAAAGPQAPASGGGCRSRGSGRAARSRA